MFYLKHIGDTMLFRNLFAIDKELAEKCRRNGCQQPDCGGPLHKSFYTRKPRGETCNIPDAYNERMSFCCGWCRKRQLPQSCLFFGRRVYWGAVVILITSAAQGVKKHKITELSITFGMTPKTIRRWITYFTQTFPYTKQWHRLRGRLHVAVCSTLLPLSLVQHFMPNDTSHTLDALCQCLKFLTSGT